MIKLILFLIIFKNQTCLTCITPPNEKSDTINVEISLTGDFSDTLSTQFSYYINPTIFYTVPILGKQSGGTHVQVFGENFIDNGDQLHCAFGTIYTKGSFINSNTISCSYYIIYLFIIKILLVLLHLMLLMQQSHLK